MIADPHNAARQSGKAGWILLLMLVGLFVFWDEIRHMIPGMTDPSGLSLEVFDCSYELGNATAARTTDWIVDSEQRELAEARRPHRSRALADGQQARSDRGQPKRARYAVRLRNTTQRPVSGLATRVTILAPNASMLLNTSARDLQLPTIDPGKTHWFSGQVALDRIDTAELGEAVCEIEIMRDGHRLELAHARTATVVDLHKGLGFDG